MSVHRIVITSWCLTALAAYICTALFPAWCESTGFNILVPNKVRRVGIFTYCDHANYDDSQPECYRAFHQITVSAMPSWLIFKHSF